MGVIVVFQKNRLLSAIQKVMSVYFTILYRYQVYFAILYKYQVYFAILNNYQFFFFSSE